MQTKNILQVINRWENVLIETIAISVIFVSAAVTANYFGWPSPDPTVKAAAAVYAYGVDGMFYICVRLARHYLSYGFSARGVGFGLFWMALSAVMGGFTWHNNLLFAATSWHISAEALQRVGFSDAQELQLHAIIPVAVVLIVAVIPRRHTKEVRTPEQIMEDARQQAALLEAQNMLRSVKAQGAGQAVSTSVGGFLGKALKLDERKAQQEAEHKARLERRQQREALEAEQRQMRLLAGPEVLEEFALLDPATGEIDYNYDGLQVRLRSLGKWPPAIAGLDDADTLQKKAIVAEQEEATLEDEALSESGNHPAFINAKAVAEILNCSVDLANKLLARYSEHPYHITGCRNRTIKRGRNKGETERVAPYKNVLEIKRKMERDRANKVRKFPSTKNTKPAQDVGEDSTAMA